jgi:uncharacterized protein
MRDDLLELVCCPECRSDLRLENPKRDAKGEILEGVLACTGCKHAYAIQDGIPNLLPPSLEED